MRKIMLPARKNLYESAKPRLKTAPRPNDHLLPYQTTELSDEIDPCEKSRLGFLNDQQHRRH